MKGAAFIGLLASCFRRESFVHHRKYLSSSRVLRVQRLHLSPSSQPSIPANVSKEEVSSFSLQSFSSTDNVARTKPKSRESSTEPIDDDCWSTQPISKRKSYTDEESFEDRSLIDLGLPLGKDAYYDIDGIPTCRIINGLWQICGTHGYQPEKERVVADMTRHAFEGFITFDVADTYGPAQDFIGSFTNGPLSSSISRDCRFFTQWTPDPVEASTTRSAVTDVIDRAMGKMGVERLDLLQLYWSNYQNRYYYDAVAQLMNAQQRGRIKQIGLCFCPTRYLADLLDEGAPIVTNQVAFSVLDTRPLRELVPLCQEADVKLLCHGSLLGGFVSSEWVRRPEPRFDRLPTAALKRYFSWIKHWGGWSLFQELLTVLETCGNKHGVSIPNVAVRWVLDQPTVGSVIIGTRLGLREHLHDNRRVFRSFSSLQLDDEDRAAIAAVQEKSQDLFAMFGESPNCPLIK